MVSQHFSSCLPSQASLHIRDSRLRVKAAKILRYRATIYDLELRKWLGFKPYNQIGMDYYLAIKQRSQRLRNAITVRSRSSYELDNSALCGATSPESGLTVQSSVTPPVYEVKQTKRGSKTRILEEVTDSEKKVQVLNDLGMTAAVTRFKDSGADMKGAGTAKGQSVLVDEYRNSVLLDERQNIVMSRMLYDTSSVLDSASGFEGGATITSMSTPPRSPSKSPSPWNVEVAKF